MWKAPLVWARTSPLQDDHMTASTQQALPTALSAVVHLQAGDIITSLLQADGTRTNGASLKSLALAPDIRAKSATYALCREALKRASP